MLKSYHTILLDDCRSVQLETSLYVSESIPLSVITTRFLSNFLQVGGLFTNKISPKPSNERRLKV